MPSDKAPRGSARAKVVREGDTHLRPAASLREFANDPVGRCISGASFVYAWPTPALCVTALWGTPDPDALEALAALYALELEAPATPHASVIDTVRVDAVHSDAFGVIARYVERQSEMMSKFVTRLAIVHRAGLVGAVAAGFYETVAPPYPVKNFGSFGEALSFAGGPTWVELEIDSWVKRSADVPDLLRDVRRALEARLTEIDIERLASDLAMTVRTLQRRLKEAGTTFSREYASCQLLVAKRWLETTEESITRIAYEVGCGTPQHLSALFRQHEHVSPSEWRAMRRKGS